MIKYLIKFVSERDYAESLLDGNLFMRPVSYYHKLELGQGDLREAAIFDSTCIYKNNTLPIYCMYAVNDSDINNEEVIIPQKCIKDFKCEDGFMVLINYELFEPMLSTVNTNGYELGAAKVNYHKLTFDDSEQLLHNDTLMNLFIKHPYFAYQNEYRIVVAKQVYKPENPMIDHVVYSFPTSLKNVARIVAMSQLSRQNENYLLNITNGN